MNSSATTSTRARPNHAVHPARTSARDESRGSLWLAGCTVSLLIYLLCSDAVRAFFNEVARLSGKL